MPKPRKNKTRIAASVDIDVSEYLESLKSNKLNASYEVNEALRKTPGFRKFIKERNEATLKEQNENDD